MTKKIIFDITLTIVIIYIFFIYNVENMTEITSDIQKFKDDIGKLYKADIEHIRYLYEVAKKLQTDKLTIPGELIVGSTAGTSGTNGEIKFANCVASGYISVGSALIKQSGDIEGNNLNLKGSISNIGNVTVTKGSIIVSSDNDKGDLIQLINTQKKNNDQSNKWIISNTKSDDINYNKLSFTRINGNIDKGSALDLYDNGNVNIPGNLKVNNLLVNDYFQKRNKAQFIRVGNVRTLSSVIPHINGVEITDYNSEFAVDYWTLIEIRVYDHTGSNISFQKDVEKLEGEPFYDYDDFPTHTPNNIVNGTIFASNKPSDNFLTTQSIGYHGGRGIHQLQIDLTKEHDISHIELYNRYNYDYAISSRMNGTVVELISVKDDKPYINRRIHTGLWTSVFSKEYIL